MNWEGSDELVWLVAGHREERWSIESEDADNYNYSLSFSFSSYQLLRFMLSSPVEHDVLAQICKAASRETREGAAMSLCSCSWQVGRWSLLPLPGCPEPRDSLAPVLAMYSTSRTVRRHWTGTPPYPSSDQPRLASRRWDHQSCPIPVRRPIYRPQNLLRNRPSAASPSPLSSPPSTTTTSNSNTILGCSGSPR